MVMIRCTCVNMQMYTGRRIERAFLDVWLRRIHFGNYVCWRRVSILFTPSEMSTGSPQQHVINNDSVEREQVLIA
jgi:hypothetical protein